MKNILYSTILPISFLASMMISSISYSQVAGCNDPLATNYNASATFNNGTCSYNALSYTPSPKVNPITDSLVESSGLQMAGNFLWSFNDGTGSAAIYRIDTITNTLLQRVYLQGTTNVDWEDIAFDGTHFYIGDFGNNANGARADLKIYKFPLSAIPAHTTNPVVVLPSNQISIINFSYSDQPLPLVPTSANNTKYDCEAMIVDKGRIHLFSKNWIDVASTHYVINSTNAGTYVAQPTETLSTGFLVTGADRAVGRELVALIGYENGGFFNHFLYLLTDYNSGKYFNGNKRKLDIGNVFSMGQAEGICFRDGNYGYISNEKVVSVITINQQLKTFNFTGMITTTTPASYVFTGNGNWSVSSNWLNAKIPPAILTPASEIIIQPTAGGQCILNVPYTLSSGAKLTVPDNQAFIIQGNLVVNQ